MIFVAALAWGVPALRQRRVITLANGERVWATRMGNSERSFYVTDSGDTLRNVIQGVERADFANIWVEDEGQARRVKHRLGSSATAPLRPHGVKYVPVVLVEFADKAFSVKPTYDEVRAYYDLYCNGTRDGVLYTGHGSHGSIRDYFVEQSEGEFLPEFGIIGPVRLDSAYSYYGRDTYKQVTQKTPDGRDTLVWVVSSHDKNAALFRSQAIQKAVDMGTDWDRYDNDGNGSVDMVFFVYAGLGENNGGDDDTLWPSETTWSTTINGRRFATSACTCESMPSDYDDDGNPVGEQADGVGVFIHELSHAMGLPDLYDTKYVAFGMDIWSVMDYGEYGNGGYNPGNYTAYERDFMGWRPLITIDEPTTLTIPCFAEGGNGYKIVNDANPDEYYVIENRQKMGWDDYIGRRGHGLQVTHVDYNASRWSANTVNTDPSHQYMTIIAANDDYRGSNSASSNAEYIATLAGNLYPGANEIAEVVNDVVYKGGRMNKAICQIRENEDRTVTVKFRPLGTLPQAVNLVARETGADYFVACWDEVEGAETYRVELLADGQLEQQLDSVAATDVRFDDLLPNVAYQFRVQPLSDSYLDGPWAESEYVHTSGTSITGISESELVVRIYATDGRFVSECFADELQRLNLHEGVYIVRAPSGSCRKVFIRKNGK